jgi:pimeloyl-ACP methyl ester carboxylesterase
VRAYVAAASLTGTAYVLCSDVQLMHESVEHPRVALSTANGVRLAGSVSRLTAVARFGAVPVPCRVIGFANDVTCPPHLYAEVANAVPDCDYIGIDSRAHAGYLEQPAKVNAAIIGFPRRTSE